MFKSEKVNDLFNCKLCQDVLVDPILLPCSETVCKAHTGQISNGECMLCSGTHLVPKEGFLENRIVKNLLENENLKEIETIRNDPENYISEYFGELTRQVDLRREILIEDIHKCSNELIHKIEKLKQDCLAKSKEAMKTSENISEKKSKELMGPVLKQYKFELHGKKYYKLVKDEIKMENVFGTLSGFDFDIGNMKVNVVCCL